jgi:hypothetical protein
MRTESTAVLLAIFLTVIACMIGGFLAQNLYYAFNNWTTNETMRFDSISLTFTSPEYQKWMEEYNQQGSSSSKAERADTDKKSRKRKGDTKAASSGANVESSNSNPLLGVSQQEFDDMIVFAKGGMYKTFNRGIANNILEVLWPERWIR